MSDVERRREELDRLREAKRALAAKERLRIRTTRSRTIAVPMDRMTDLFARIRAYEEDFRYELTGPDTMRAWITGWSVERAAALLGGFVSPGYQPVSLHFVPHDPGSTVVTATVPDDGAYLLGSGHLLGVDAVLTFIQEGAERWNTPSS